MVKLVVFAFLVLCGTAALAKNNNQVKLEVENELAVNTTKCNIPLETALDDPLDQWTDLQDKCIDAVRKQIQMEVDASYVYLAMGAHFSKDKVNMPGFAKMFFEHATEERSHALALIDYLLMRGPGKKDQAFTDELLKVNMPPKTTWTHGLDALKDALRKEKEVTDSIRNVIETCDANGNDYHLSDHLTGEFLEEQYRGMREISGKISTLSKMMANSQSLGLFLFDKELLA